MEGDSLDMLDSRMLAVLALALGAPLALAQEPGAPATQGSTFDAAHLEQITAPIALYPDALLSQVLMASTYPLEIVEADRWIEQNPRPAGTGLETALKGKTWDPSVKSLCGFPDLLHRLSQNLDWTQDLGDAFLGQRADLMDAIQRMRRKALDAGTLQSNSQVNVEVQADQSITIESSDPDVAYVPEYYPTAVYGGWGYPVWYYPHLYPTHPIAGPGLGWGAGIAWRGALWGGCRWGVGRGDVAVDASREANFIRNTELDAMRRDVEARAIRGDQWQHDSTHRKNVAYRNAAVAQRYRAGARTPHIGNSQARGYGGAAGAEYRGAGIQSMNRAEGHAHRLAMAVDFTRG